MAPVDTSYYDLLHVAPSATPAQLRKAFRLKALELHPDRNNDAAQATSAFQKLKAVYDILCDPDRRAQYDQFGPVSNPHADDDGQLDADSLAQFLRRAASRLSKEDINAYEKSYRDGEEEKQDLLAHYERFEGAVDKVIFYIPYSTDGDLRRFVRFWDEQIDADKLQRTPQYDGARDVLLAQAQQYDSKQAAVGDGAVDKGAEANDGANNKRSKKRGKGRQNKQGAAGDMDALAALIQKRAQRAKGQFDAWCDDIEQKAQAADEAQKAARSSRSTARIAKKARGSTRRGDGAARASRGVRKQRKSSR